jgi:hypothetical protein
MGWTRSSCRRLRTWSSFAKSARRSLVSRQSAQNGALRRFSFFFPCPAVFFNHFFFSSLAELYERKSSVPRSGCFFQVLLRGARAQRSLCRFPSRTSSQILAKKDRQRCQTFSRSHGHLAPKQTIPSAVNCNSLSTYNRVIRDTRIKFHSYSFLNHPKTSCEMHFGQEVFLTLDRPFWDLQEEVCSG